MNFDHGIHCVVKIPLQVIFPQYRIAGGSLCVVISSQIRAGASLCCDFLQHVLEESLTWKEVP